MVYLEEPTTATGDYIESVAVAVGLLVCWSGACFFLFIFSLSHFAVAHWHKYELFNNNKKRKKRKESG